MSEEDRTGRQDGDCPTIDISGSVSAHPAARQILDSMAAAELSSRLRLALTADEKRLRVDLRQIEEIDVPGLAGLVEGTLLAARAGTSLEIMAPTDPTARRFLELAALPVPVLDGRRATGEAR